MIDERSVFKKYEIVSILLNLSRNWLFDLMIL